MEANTAATYALIYHFLKHQSQNRAAEAVKKAARSFVVLRDDLKQEGPPLEDIIKEWMASRHTRANRASSSEGSGSSDEDGSSSDSSSEDTSGSESDDSSSDSTKTKKLRKAAERDTSVTLSSAGENTREVAIQVAKQDKSTKTGNKTSKSDSSDLDSSSKSSASDSSDAESSSSSPDTSDSSDEGEANANEKAPESSSDSEDESDSTSKPKDNVLVAKKRKTSENAAVTTAVATNSRHASSTSHRKEGPPTRFRERFQRVRVQNLAPDLLLDNGYDARGGARNDYGERAHRDLMVTRGAGFRKEKNKKKRGSYRGGEITMENHSIKFDF